jgi:hypothetical protein
LARLQRLERFRSGELSRPGKSTRLEMDTND